MIINPSDHPAQTKGGFKMFRQSFTRREMLRLMGLSAAGVGLAASGVPALAAPRTRPAFQDKIELEIKTVQPEYHAQCQQIWDYYLESHPDITIKLTDVNEDTQAAYDARIAAGNPADIDTQAACNKDNYQMYVNLLDIPEFNWDIFHPNAKTAFEQMFGIPNYVPMVNPVAGYFFTFIYYKDRMIEAGLDPKASIKTVDDVRTMLATLKAYVDKDPKLEYVLDTGWHPWAWGTMWPSAWALGLGHGKAEMRDLFLGKIRWDDKAKNPYVPVFELMKEFYEKGYLPQKWWTRNWDEYENGFIAQKSILTFHGPWLWDKVGAANPDAGAQLDGAFWPADSDNNLFVTPTAAYAYNTNAAAIYTGNKAKPNADAALAAFLWWHTPETIKMVCEAIGMIPSCDLSSVGGADVKHPQYVQLIKAVLEGKAAPLKFDDSLMGTDVAGQYKKGGSEMVMEQDAMATLYGDYLEGKTSLDDLLKILQGRFDAAYELPKA
jgi:hypothetical protein